LDNADRNLINNNTCGGIKLGYFEHPCSYNNFSGNIIQGPDFSGIWLGPSSSKNTFHDNIIAEYRGFGVEIAGYPHAAENNTFYRNTFENNKINAGFYSDRTPIGTGNLWDNGEEGNYWSDYHGIDNDGDGIGDTPYIIGKNNRDNYPLTEPIEIPEFPSWIVLPLFLGATLFVIIIKKKMLHSI
jgi:parallel beta-helix repeat protein